MFTKSPHTIPPAKKAIHPAFAGKVNKKQSFIPAIQTKLQVDHPDSLHETEADRMADHVVSNLSNSSTASFIAPSAVQTVSQSVSPNTSQEPEKVVNDIVPPIPGEDSETTSEIEPQTNPPEEKQETDIPPVPDKIPNTPGNKKEKGGGGENASAWEEKEEENPPVSEADDVTAEDAAAFTGEPSLEPVAQVEITPELSNQFIQEKSNDTQEEEAKQEEEEQLQTKVQLKSTDPDDNADIEHGLASSKTGGHPLEKSTRKSMEQHFQADFSEVKIHTDKNAREMNNEMGAKAFTHKNHIYFNENQYNPSSKEGKHLLAHELTHTVQQGAAIQRKPKISSTAPKIQRGIISRARNYFAGKARHIPGFRMFTIILGRNPINGDSVSRSAANIIRAMVEFLPGGTLITKSLDNHGIFDRVSTWFKTQIDGLGISASSVVASIKRFIKSLGIRDLGRLGSVWRRAKSIVVTPIKRLIKFAKSLVKQIIKWVKEAILKPLAELASKTPAYDLLRVVLGKDPITGDPFPPTAENLIGGFMKLIGQEEVWLNIKKGNAISRAFEWFKGALSGLKEFAFSIPSTIIATIKSLTWQDIVLVVGAFQKVGKAFLNVASRFLSWAGGTVLDLLEIIFSVVAPAVVPWLKKAGGAFSNILKNPIGFLGNLVKAAKNGFMKFAANIASHLKKALINWLMGSLAGAGIYIPQSLSIKEIIKFVLSVLGITWANLRIKLVKHLGEPAVKALETGFEMVTLLVTKGPLALWERIKEKLSDLKSMIIGEISSWVVVQVVKKAIVKLVSSLNPAGAVIQAILFIYDTVTFLIDKISQIARVGMAVLNSMAAIAGGAIGTAVKKVEQTLAGMLTLAIGFLAKFMGLGKISKKIVSIVKKVKDKIDGAIDKVVGWIVKKAKKFLKKLVTTGTPKDPKARLQIGMKKAVAAVNKLSGKVTKKLINPVLGGIKARYQFQTLNAYEKGGKWWIKGKVNPDDDVATSADASSTESDTEEKIKLYSINPSFTVYANNPDEFESQIKQQEAGINKMKVLKWSANRAKFIANGRGKDDLKKLRDRIRKDIADHYIQENKEEFRDMDKSQVRKKAQKYAKSILTRYHAILHNPDQVAGGNAMLSGLYNDGDITDATSLVANKLVGHGGTNSSIGSQWAKQGRIQGLDSHVNAEMSNFTEDQKKNKIMNVKLAYS